MLLVQVLGGSERSPPGECHDHPEVALSVGLEPGWEETRACLRPLQ